MPSYKVSGVFAREVLDSRGNPTVEAVVSAGKVNAYAIVPSGASKGKHEAVELRDGGKRFLGRGVLSAVSNVNSVISKKVKGMDCRNQGKIDDALIALDATPDKSNLGANAMLAVSLAVARAAAMASNKPLHRIIGSISSNKKFVLPVPFCNVINGGRHAGSSLKLQEFMLVPVKAKTFKEAMAMVSETYNALKGLIERAHGKSAVNVGDEGGFAPDLKSPEQALILLEKAVEQSGYKGEIKLAIDAAASEIFRNGYYDLGKIYHSADLLDYYIGIVKSYKIVSLEDPFHQEDFEAFAELTRKSGIQIVGDDLLATNVSRIRTAAAKRSCNCLLLKANQIGTLSEAISAASLAFRNKWKVMVSHRSGDSEDAFISDLSVGIGCGQIKAGAPARGERTAKYNQILRIEDEFGLKMANFRY